MKRIGLFFLFFIVSTGLLNAQKKALSDYDLIWLTPGLNSQGSMPLGNGDIGVNQWVEENGDFVFYISKTDAWSENGHLLKLGLIRISLFSNHLNGKSFNQKLELEKGVIIANYGDARIRLWVDANHPTIQVDIDSKTPLKAKVSFETWRKERKLVKGTETSGIYGVSDVDKSMSFINPIYTEADTVISNNNNNIISCHHNSYSQWKANLELQALDEMAKINADPLLDLNYGVCIEADGFVSSSDTSLLSKSSSTHFQVNVYPFTQTGSIADWKESVVKKKEDVKKLSSQKRQKAHYQWWEKFWNRNYIFITSKDAAARHEAEMVTQGYILQHFMNTCAGRGNFPIKFNGSIFTVDTYNRKGSGEGLDADFRRWGGPYWWQNTRLIYWSMLISGDFEMMKPLFKMYMDALPLRQAATKKYYNHEGAFFPETMNFWGAFTNTNYGINRDNLAHGEVTNRYIRYYWQGSLELSLMMLDYYSFTNDKEFAKNTLVPFVSEILIFFYHHWKRGEDKKILFSPAMSLETFHTAVNPLPEIVGIRKVAEKMLALPGAFTSSQQTELWKNLIQDLPAIPQRVINGDTLLAPAQTYSDINNKENPELYAVFPYRTFGIGKPGMDVALNTFEKRTHKDNGGWIQNSIQAAYLGLADSSKKMIVESFSTWDKNFRFPAFWGPNYDWTPDQDHGCVAMNALQRMIIQYEDNEVRLLPAWPKEWDLSFKVSGPNKTIFSGTIEEGRITTLKVSGRKRVDIIK
ncbi:DUF5703 domain-containing protein [Flavitalea sp.]|nr:DUF5703 domain-containing protein [Flavitalea sp.]